MPHSGLPSQICTWDMTESMAGNFIFFREINFLPQAGSVEISVCPDTREGEMNSQVRRLNGLTHTCLLPFPGLRGGLAVPAGPCAPTQHSLGLPLVFLSLLLPSSHLLSAFPHLPSLCLIPEDREL